MGGRVFGLLSKEDRMIKRGHEAKPREFTPSL